MRQFSLVLLALGAASVCNADIEYNTSQTIGAGGVTGFIETDGTIGTLNTGNILDWDLLVNTGVSTFDLVGPLSALR